MMSLTELAAALRRPLVVGVTSFVLVSAFAVSELSDVDWEPSHFAAFGEEAREIRAYAEERLGSVVLRPQLGHDGRFFFVQANDPWVLEPEENALILDHPLYRTQRMFYPVVAGGLGFFGPDEIVWAMLVVNLVAMGVGAWAVARIATAMGASPWWGLAFLLNLGFISELDVGGAGIVAGAAAFGAVAMILNGRSWEGVALLTVAALTREVMLIVAVGAGFHLWRRGERREATATAVMPLAAVLSWAIYLRTRIDLEIGSAQVQGIGVPFVGLFEAFESWINDPLDLIVGLAVLLMLALFVRRAVLHDNLIGWAFLGFVPLTVVLTEEVWHSYFDITRAVAPLLTAFVLLVALGDDSPGKVSSESSLSEGA